MYIKASATNEISQREIENSQIARKAATESIVLLKNNGVLPLENNTIALFGAGAVSTVKGGTGSGDVNVRDSVSILQGFENAGILVESKKWCEEFNALYNKSYDDWLEKLRKDFSLKKAVMLLNEPFILPCGNAINEEDCKDIKTDTAMYVVSRLSGEGADIQLKKGEYYLADEEIQSIEYLSKRFQKLVVILNTGSSIDISPLQDMKIDALLTMSQLGMEGGNALADVLLGKVSPSGKLTNTWYKTYKDVPFGDEYSTMGKTIDAYYKEDIYVGYKYCDSFNVEPLYPFGFGLGYTDFLTHLVNSSYEKGKLSLSVEVENAGRYTGKEVIQVYVRLPNETQDTEYQRLIAFSKTKDLAPKEKDILYFDISIEDFASYNEEKSSFILSKGNYIICFGNSSKNTQEVCAIVSEEDFTTSKHKNIFTNRPDITTLKSPNRSISISPTLKTFSIEKNDIQTKTIEYNDINIKQRADVDKILSQLTPKEKSKVVVGGGFFGTPAVSTFGSVGKTTTELTKKGLINVDMVDGPAGIRLSRRTVVIKNKKAKILEMAFPQFNAFPQWLKNRMLGKESQGQVYYNYATAFPIATALAQTWNMNLLTEVGKAISREMIEFGATFWLAPALNIQRNPLCGRNFEYFSEDPLVSGKCTIALTEGVQSIPGNYVTIKHFACNNQEYERKHSNSIVSVRALRELYLKGFELAVKNSNPRSVMTSYNKLNNIYTPNSIELNTTILRQEWNFTGLVMTDWMSTSKDAASVPQSISCGNDLIMPGSKGEYKEIYAAFKKGSISEKELNTACYNIISSILDSNVYKERCEYLL